MTFSVGKNKNPKDKESKEDTFRTWASFATAKAMSNVWYYIFNSIIVFHYIYTIGGNIILTLDANSIKYINFPQARKIVDCTLF